MKQISASLFDALRTTSTNLVLGWKVIRKDGYTLGFTTSDVPFTYDGLEYEPSNAFSGMAVTSKSDFSVDNTSAAVLTSDKITEWDLQAGLWDSAAVEMFWIDPGAPGMGIVPIRGGTLGEVKIKNGKFEAELRSPFQKLQQPFGKFYTLECQATFGDNDCKVGLDCGPWQPGSRYMAKAGADAGIGSCVKPAVQTGYWYQCISAQGGEATVTSTPSSPSGGSVSVEGETPYGESYYLESDVQHGTMQNSSAYLTPTKQGSVPKSAPDGVQPLTVTNTSSTIVYALGYSGTVEPTWPQTLGATVTDNQLVWKCIRARRLTGTVTAVLSRSHFLDVNRPSSSEPEPLDWWRYGVIEWLTGANRGLKMEVSSYGANGAFALLEAMPGDILAGDQYEAVKGCGKTRSSCKAADNLNNFSGFPDMPTEEKALATANITTQGVQKNSGGS